MPNYGLDQLASNAVISQNKYGVPAQSAALQNLMALLQGQGRVDPRLLATAQASNARSTAQQQQAVRGGLAGRGLQNSGVGSALQAAIGSAGANRAANLSYQDIADSYGRNQQNLGLAGMLASNPNQAYTGMGLDYSKFIADQKRQKSAARAAAISQLVSSFGSAAAGCWVAEAIFGDDADETHLARYYVNNIADDGFKAAYLGNGRLLADVVRNDKALRDSLVPAFLAFGQATRIALGV